MDISTVISKINWAMLYDQKLVLLDFLEFIKEDEKLKEEFVKYLYAWYENDDPEDEYLSREPEYSFASIEGLINLLDDLIDAAQKKGKFNHHNITPRKNLEI